MPPNCVDMSFCNQRCKRCVQHDMETERLCETGDLDDYESDDSDVSANKPE